MWVKPGCAANTQGELRVQTSRVTRRACLKMAVGRASRLPQLRLAAVPSRARRLLVAGRRPGPLTFERASSQRARSEWQFTLSSRSLHRVKLCHGGDVRYTIGRRGG